ncbi:NAD(P)-binding protein [Phenylobacterium sp.]|uniref:NAD(P)-binding protein n=1 Tax=Phenylobacterium sp. TaxID=1871053 RepID=UPI002F3F262A
MTKVRIVGGGLAGVLAALEAHRLGARRIELHERYDQLGGRLAPRIVGGLELRDACVTFGGREDPVRRLLEWHGAAFDDFDNTCGSVNPCSRGEPVAARGFAGPVLEARDPAYGRLTGEALTDRLRAYPAELNAPLTRYCQWRLGVWLDEVHASAALPLGLDQIRVTGAHGGETSPAVALPHGGFGALFASARRALESLGVTVRFASLVSPREILDVDEPDTVTVWTPSPVSLFPALGKAPPKRIGKAVASYVFRARHAGPVPFMLQNFTARGSVFRLSLYPSRGETLLLAECVAEVSDADLRREIHELMAGFDSEGLKLGDTLAVSVRTRWDCPSVDFVRKLSGLRSALAQAKGPAFVTGAWEAGDPTERFCKVSRGLHAALAEEIPPARAAA